MSSTSSRPVWEYASRKHEQAAALYLKTHHARQKPSFSFRMTRAFCIFTDGTDDIQVFTSRKNNSHEMQECRRLSHYPYKVSGISRPVAHGMKVMSEARKMMTSSQLCHPPGAVTAFLGTGLTTKRCSRPVGNRIPNGRESCSQGLGILFPVLGNPIPGRLCISISVRPFRPVGFCPGNSTDLSRFHKDIILH